MVRQKLADDAVIRVAEAQYIPPYKIHLWFSDGAEQIADFEKFLKQSHHPEIRKYMNKRLFRQFSVAHGRLEEPRVAAVLVEVHRQQHGLRRPLRGAHQAHRRVHAEGARRRR